MTKRKYKIFIDITLILLCLFPLLVIFVSCIYNSDLFIGQTTFTDFIQKFTISNDLANKITTSIQGIGIATDGMFFPCVAVIMSNSILIYMFYVFVSVLVFVPKMAIKLLNISIGEKN